MILLDEPTSHLDINHQVEIHELIRRLNLEKNLTVLNISHDLNLAAEYCHRMVLLHRGSIYALGTPSTVITEENIRRVYETTVMVEKNPISGAPRVTPVGKSRMGKNRPAKNDPSSFAAKEAGWIRPGVCSSGDIGFPWGF